MKDFVESLIAIIGAVVLIGILFLLVPLLTFFFGWLAGLLAKVAIGVPLCNALNMLLNVSYFTPDKLPMMGGALGWVGSFFKTSVTNKSK